MREERSSLQNSFVLRTNSPSETQHLASSLSSYLKAGDVISLTGDLGAGKTCFTQGLARSLGIKDRITSPTFSIIKEYKNVLSLYHFDVYRLNSPDELYDLGYEEYFYGDGITVIEWGDKIEKLLPADFLKIAFKRLFDDNVREIEITYQGKRWGDVAKKWLKEIPIAKGEK